MKRHEKLEKYFNKSTNWATAEIILSQTFKLMMSFTSLNV